MGVQKPLISEKLDAHCIQDRTILGTAIPAISNEFRSFGDIAWYEAGFPLPLCTLQLSFGRILVSSALQDQGYSFELTWSGRPIIPLNGVSATSYRTYFIGIVCQLMLRSAGDSCSHFRDWLHYLRDSHEL